MKGFVQGANRQQTTLLPECLDDWVDESNPVRAVDVFVDSLELRDLGFDGVDPAATGRPAYHPSPMLKLYIYGYLNRVQSSRRLEREAGLVLRHYWTNACRTCALKAQCTKGLQRCIKRWEHEHVIDAVQTRLDKTPDAMRTRRETVEHPFGTLKMRMQAVTRVNAEQSSKRTMRRPTRQPFRGRLIRLGE
jgi:hypothetical protein